MSRFHYYNEFDPYAAEWLRNLIAAGHLPAGEVDTRSIVDVQPADLSGFVSCHFFAGIGGWPLAARLAGWPDDREIWTGSPPCQPFSVAGKGKAQGDDRHLWPHLFRLASARRPAVLMGEQVAAAVGKDWLDGVFADMEGIGYACGAAVVPACAIDAPHRRDRLWFVARDGAVGHGFGAGLEGLAGHGDDARGRTKQDRPAAAAGCGCDVADTSSGRCSEPASRKVQQPRGAEAVGRGEAGDVADAGSERRIGRPGIEGMGRHAAERREAVDHSRNGSASHWSNRAWIIGHDGKARRVEPGIRLLAHGVPARVGRLRAYGNAIVPQVAAEVIGAFMDCMP